MLSRLSVGANARGTALLEQVRAEEPRVAREVADRRVAQAISVGDLEVLIEELRKQLDGERTRVLQLLQTNEDLEAENVGLWTYR